MTMLHPFRLLILFLAMFLACESFGQASPNEKWLLPGKTIRFRLAVSKAVPDLSDRLAGEFDKTGFGDVRSSETGLWILSFDSSDDYPLSEGSSLGLEFGVDYRLRPKWWVGLSVGRDASAGASGFRRISSSSISIGQPGNWPLFYSLSTSGHTAYRFVSSAYLGIRAEYQLTPRCSVHLGPTLDLRWISNGEQFQYQVRKEWRPGGVAGVQVSLNRWLRVFAEGRLRSAVTFDGFSIESSDNDGEYKSYLSSFTLRMSHIRLGARVDLAF
ncbi:MAG: hypothetical protein R2787_06465 [Saprospiraceae bacterium]